MKIKKLVSAALALSIGLSAVLSGCGMTAEETPNPNVPVVRTETPAPQDSFLPDSDDHSELPTAEVEPENSEAVPTVTPAPGTPPESTHEHEYAHIEVIDPTCIEKGYTVFSCECGESYNDNLTEPVGHSFEETVFEPTTEAEGYTVFLCTVCGYTETGNIVAKLESGLSEVQMNSINMLNYLTVLSQEISASNNSRLFLESAYSSLINNTFPNAVDIRTEAHLEDLLDTLENFRMISVKKERLEYIYEQNRAKALRAAIPNPVGLLSAIQSGNALKAMVSVVYMAVDSYSSYMSYTEETDLQYLQDGWEFDDAAAKEIHNTRSMTFSYMLDMVRNNDIPGDYTLSEDAVEEFVEWKNNGNISRRIRFLESNEGVYEAFGEYWLTLAESYYENGEYGKCLDAVRSYEAITSRIFRKDYGYAKVLPLAIVSARETCSKDEYVDVAREYLPLIVKNSDIDDWAINYFVAQTYIDLHKKTNDDVYLENAYNLMVDVVNELIDEQQSLNEQYLKDIVKLEADKDADKTEKNEIKQYNKMLTETRKTELPPISEPLLLCSEIVYALAEELNLSVNEKKKIDGMLHENGQDLFMNQIIDGSVRFFEDKSDVAVKDMSITYEAGEIHIPVSLVTQTATVVVSVDGTDTQFADWTLTEVVRDGTTIDTFYAIYTSESAKKFDYEDGMSICLDIFMSNDSVAPAASASFSVVAKKVLWVVNSVSFERK